MKKIFSVLLCLLFLFAVSACTQKNNGTESVEEQREAQAIYVVSGFYNDVRSSNPCEYEKYFKTESDCTEIYKIFTDFGDEAESILLSLNVSDTEKRDGLLKSLTQRLYGTVDYAIDSVNSDADEVKIKVTAIYPDFNNGAAFDTVDYKSLLDEAFGVDTSNLHELEKMLYERKGIENIDIENVDIYTSDIFSDELSDFYSLAAEEIFAVLPMKTLQVEYEVAAVSADEWKITKVNIL